MQLLRNCLMALSFAIACEICLAEPRNISWSNLQPDSPALREKLKSLPQEDRVQLMRAVNQLKGLKSSSTETHVQDTLARQVLDFEKLRASKLMTELDGTEVRIDGYLLPLQQKGELVTEFLLVPVVGACIHVPPPPPNQMILVSFPTGFPANGQFSPVTIEGPLRAKALQTNLSLVDGAADIDVGYSVLANTVSNLKKR